MCDSALDLYKNLGESSDDNAATSKEESQKCACTNPINSGTGNKHQHETDYTGAGTNPLHAEREYNSGGTLPASVEATVWGSRWRGYYDRSISYASDGTSLRTATLKRSDGKQYSFKQAIGNATPPLTTTTWTPDADVVGTLTEIIDANSNPAGWTYVNGKDETESYDAAGKLVSITSRAGFAQTLTYSDGTTGTNGGYVLDATGVSTGIPLPAGLLIRVTDPAGRTLGYGYDASNRVVKMIDPAGGVYIYKYDSNNNLVSVTYPDSKIRKYLYGEASNVSSTPDVGVSYVHSLTSIVDENGNHYASWTYDAAGRATSSEHGVSGSGIDHVGLSYTAPNSNGDSTTTVTDVRGETRTYSFSSIIGTAKNTGIAGQPCNGCIASFTYDANGNVASSTDFNGNVTTYQYNPRNLEISRTEGYGTSLARTITTQWDANFRLPTLITEPGRTTAYSYDPATGNVLTRTVTDTASNTSRAWHYAYTTSLDGTLPNLVKTVTDPLGNVTTFGYYPNGDLKTLTDALGHVTTIDSYDGNGRPQSITDPNNVTTTLTYTKRGWLQTRTINKLTTTYSYDGVGDLTQVKLPDGSHLNYTYDAAHRLTSIYDAALDHVDYVLDNAGNRTEEDVYDSAGNITQKLTRSFDNLDHLTQLVRYYNTSTAYATNYTYDANGNLTKSTDALNHATAYAYDALNRISQVTDAANGATKYTYDALDQLTDVTDPKNFNTHYAMNSLGEDTQLTSPDTGSTGNTYDLAGNLTGTTDARGIAETIAYDALNRPVSVSFPTTGENIGYTWDVGTGCTYGIGRLCQVTDADGTTSFAYDERGNLTKKIRTESGVSFTTQYAYNGANRLTAIMTPTGETISMVRDVAGRVAQVSDTDGSGTRKIASNLQYDGSGKIVSELMGNNVTQTNTYDWAGQIVAATAARPMTPADIDAGTVRLLVAGSPLKQLLFEPALLNLFEPGSMSVFEDGTVSGSTATATGATDRAYFGVVANAALNTAIPPTLIGKKVLIQDNSAGGSVNGAVSLGEALAIPAMSVDGACAATGTSDAQGQPLWACPNTVSAVPDASLSVVQPRYFTGMNLPAGMQPLSTTQQNDVFPPTQVVGEVMGIIATDNFLSAGPGGTDALPSLTKPEVAALMGGRDTDWSQTFSQPAAGPVTVCRGAPGTGAQVAINTFIFGYPCTLSNLTPFGYGQYANSNGSGNYTVIENTSPDALARCMGYAQNGTPAGETIDLTTGAVSTAPVDATHIILPAGGRAIGVMSLTRPSQNSATEPYHFVAINGVSPSVEHAVIGQYDLIVNDVMNRRTAAIGGSPALAGDQLDLYTLLASVLGQPALLGGTKTPPLPGLMTIADPAAWNYDPTTTVYNGQTVLINPVSRISNANICQPPQQVQ